MKLVLLLLGAVPLIAVGCNVDEDCNLNGLCTAGSCACNAGWRGGNCSLLHRLPAATRGDAAIYGLAPNRTSWGGNALLDPVTGLHHLFVAEISGPNGSQCGLAAWGSHSTISHAVSKTGLQGPYSKESVVVHQEGHNPQVILYKGKWIIFHIGSGSAPGTPVSPCHHPPGPPPAPAPQLCAALPVPSGYSCHGAHCSGPTPSAGRNCGAYLSVPDCSSDDCAATVAALCDKDPRCKSFALDSVDTGKGKLHSQLFSGGASCLVPNADWTTYVKTPTPAATSAAALPRAAASAAPGYIPSTIHTSDSPDGPFVGLSPNTLPRCNNPSPFVLPNHTILVACGFSIFAADGIEGPWRHVTAVSFHPTTRMGVPGMWEDPFLWQDINDNWHMFSHTYTRQPGGPGVQNSISGHLFARDVHGPWHVTAEEPYDNVVSFGDGSSETYSTMERPKLIFNGQREPVAIINGVSPTYPCGSCKGFGDAPPEGGCCWCKVTPGEDWTFTLMQPLQGNGTAAR